MKWKGVIAAMTTCFDERGEVDHGFIAAHARWIIDNGCSGIVAPGSLSEAATLRFEEKLAVLRTYVKTLQGRAPVVGAISSPATNEAVNLAKAAHEIGCNALMIFPPYLHMGDWREMKTHGASVMRATELPCMLYNNPICYRTDFLPEQIQELANEHPNLEAVKESTGDVRRVTAIRMLVGDRLDVLGGADDAIVEEIGAGATGCVSGLPNALPRESVDLFNYAIEGKSAQAFELYRWFLPLLRFDAVPKSVQLIKLLQEELGVGSARVRAPRLQVVGEELDLARKTIREAMRHRPKSASTELTQMTRSSV